MIRLMANLQSLVILMLIGLAVVGCSQQQAPQAAPAVTMTAPGPTVTVTTTPEPEVNRLRYDTARDLRDALVDADLRWS